MLEITQEARAEETDCGVSFQVTISSVVNYASWQNSVPLLSMVELHNSAEHAQNNLTLELSFTPSFAKAKSWKIDRLPADETLSLSNLEVTLDPDYLRGLDEAEKGVAVFHLRNAEGELVAEHRKELRLLARDEWGGFAGMASIAAAFVMPNDPAIAQVQRDAGEVLVKYGYSPALDGYQSKDPKRVYMLGAALWSAVAGMGLMYAEPPKSFEVHGQKVRRPSTIREQGLATCFDSTLFFASALEAIGLNPVVLIIEGHSYCGFWLRETTLPSLIEQDPTEIRKALAARELIVFETTGITRRPADQFDKAIAIAKSYTNEENEAGFIGAIDIARARASQIRPMASHQAASSENHAEAPEFEATTLPLPKAPSFDALPTDEAKESPRTPKDRIARWQNKLLDLSLRNRLLNFKSTKQTVPFLCTDVPLLEDRLAERKKIRVISLPEENPHGERDEDLHLKKTGQDLDEEFAAQAIARNELPSTLEKRELDKRLTELFRRAKNDLNEGGSNTLFLAVGFLRWKKSADDEKAYKAPLLLIPVKLTRKSAASRFNLEHHEDEVRFNATLMEFLKKDYNLSLPPFDAKLPTDESGIDVPYVFEMVRKAVRDVPGFEVVDETALSTFSFAKFLMWKDLVERTDDLRKNRVVRHLIDNPDKAFEPGVSTAFPSERDIDVKYDPKDIITPLPADSSQLSAVMAAVEGQDFILVGPPGTGKSQTITNMIAQCLANNKSVLFVAEKTAALDVVYRRLREHGLGEFCLELHSNKAERKQFLEQLKTSWEQSSKPDTGEWVRINEQLKVRRDHLNDYITALHTPSACGLTVFDALGLAVKHANEYIPKLTWDNDRSIGKETLAQLQDTVSNIASVHREVQPIPALNLVKHQDWSVRWEHDLINVVGDVSRAIHELLSQLDAFNKYTDFKASIDLTLSDIEDICSLAELLLSTQGTELGVIFEERLDEIKETVRSLEEDLVLFKAAGQSLSASYDEKTILRLPIDSLDHSWREACSKMWPFSVFAKGKVKKLLQTYARAGEANPETDIACLREMQDALTSLEDQEETKFFPDWNGTGTDPNELLSYFDLAGKIDAAFRQINHLSNATVFKNEKLRSSLSEGRADDPLRLQASKLIEAAKLFRAELGRFCDITGSNKDHFEGAGILQKLQDDLSVLKENAKQLQIWTEWQKVKTTAENQDLTPFIEAVENKLIPHEDLGKRFAVAFANWWLPEAIDNTPVLRSFKRFKHEEMLQQFRKLDDQVRATAAYKVQSALNHKLPSQHAVPKSSELGTLRHQMNLKRPSKSIRDVISAMPGTFSKLAPCLLMSPLSISQYLPAGQSQFDVVIFDEASQITTWDAVGAIARGTQTIIVGDPKQLPPTNFFGRSEQDDDEELEAYEKDLESILEEAKASGLPNLQLNWHYRSRHESLIAFSNWHYYDNRLITFPSPVVADRAVKLVHTPDAIYDRGKSRTNKLEAQNIVKEAVKRLRKWIDLPEEDRPTLGVITFNQQQQSLIQDLFDAELRNHPELEWFFADERIEPVIVRNLENVQGDERDVMMFSITFAPDIAGKMSMSFGAINKDGGERRLNVAITRAREELLIFSTVTADAIDTSRTKALGVKHLKEFLSFAEKGTIALAASDDGSVGGYDSPFEEAVSEALQMRGWTIVPQVGVSGFRVDLGIVHPDKPGAFIAGVECDGATYHSSATARDRDKVREQVLRNLGWEILRIWSPDWWYDSQHVADEIHHKLRDLLVDSRTADKLKAEQAAEAEKREEEHLAVKIDEDTLEASPEDPEEAVEADRGEPEQSTPLRGNSSAMSAASVPSPTSKPYEWTDLSGLSPNPDKFHDSDYAPTLSEMIRKIVSDEGPIKDTALAQRITKAHGWSRTGAVLRREIEKHFANFELHEETTGTFVWEKDSKTQLIGFRPVVNKDYRRSVTDIPIAEIAGLIDEQPHLLSEEDPVNAIARTMGYDRVAAAIRARVAEAIDYFRAHSE
ncbi:ATP-dependent RecD-like DNA helicase [Pseudovibrio sp. Ad46]|uniref:DUF3320 domain-containing protein n=1 Tax=Pseudovibrio sp. Ad46 TaxID=989432 RepID=UPI0007AE47F0|nr:DUF3320 domain-containing protein [Pseudovibrio sp. Ad46]KZK95430.1 ATP-dependent RecD-like DNA helicase [Pseudovibrio sp. Ad46]